MGSRPLLALLVGGGITSLPLRAAFNSRGGDEDGGSSAERLDGAFEVGLDRPSAHHPLPPLQGFTSRGERPSPFHAPVR